MTNVKRKKPKIYWACYLWPEDTEPHTRGMINSPLYIFRTRREAKEQGLQFVHRVKIVRVK
jgi:hypothetical protein